MYKNRGVPVHIHLCHLYKKWDVLNGKWILTVILKIKKRFGVHVGKEKNGKNIILDYIIEWSKF